MVEYIDQNISKLEWQQKADADSLAPFDYHAQFIISGSKKSISIWEFIGSPGNYEQLPIIEVGNEHCEGPVSQVHLIGRVAFVSLFKSTVLLYKLDDDGNHKKSLILAAKRTNLHDSHSLNDMLFSPQTNSVITCGNDGTICYFDIEQERKPVKSVKVANTALKCIDILNRNEIICGTLTGSLKHFDIRTEKVVGTFSSKSQSSILSIQKNPNVNHLALAGNDEGFINLYDLRNEDSAVAKIPAHGAAVTSVKYKPRDSGTMYSSSCDGMLFKWNINTDFTTSQRPKAESLVSSSDCFSINCFDVNQHGHLIYATDQEAIHYLKPQKLTDY